MNRTSKKLVIAVSIALGSASTALKADIEMDPGAGNGVVITNIDAQPGFEVPVCYSDGTSGATGELGNCITPPVGPAGPTGATGPQGEPGPVGATGPQGEQGPTGATGLVGPQGDTGPQGAMGPAGADGAMGPPGVDGAMGPQGEPGPAGAMGPTGPAGPQGDTGPQGLQGEPGPAAASVCAGSVTEFNANTTGYEFNRGSISYTSLVKTGVQPVSYGGKSGVEASVKCTGVLSDFEVTLDTPPGSNRGYNFEVVVGEGSGSGTDLQCAVAGTATTCQSDPGSSVTLYPGDIVSIYVRPTGSWPIGTSAVSIKTTFDTIISSPIE